MPSKANIYGHPIHPMLVAFPIVFFIMALVADVGYEAGWAGTDWPQFAYILLIGGIATALAAAIAGLIEYSIIVDEETKQKANGHMVLNMAVLVLQAVNLSYRGHAKSNHYWRHGWILSLVSVVLLTISGWLGQELVYKHRMGVRLRPVEGKRKRRAVALCVCFSMMHTYGFLADVNGISLLYFPYLSVRVSALFVCPLLLPSSILKQQTRLTLDSSVCRTAPPTPKHTTQDTVRGAPLSTQRAGLVST